MTEIESIDAIDFTTVTTKMPYLDAVIMEINRLYPSVPATLRVIERETRLRTSRKAVVLKPGMLVYLSYLHMHTSPKYWGADASEFDPHRFLNGSDQGKPFMAFGSGTRDCVSDIRGSFWCMLVAYNYRLVINSPFWLLRCTLSLFCGRIGLRWMRTIASRS